MPDYELHADYDRDGKVTASASEYALRLKRPALLRANIDRDDRALPSGVTPGKPVASDGDLPPRSGDDEPSPFLIRPNVPAPFPDVSFFLRLLGVLGQRMRLLDDRGSRIPPFTNFRPEYQLKFTGKPMPLRLEALALPGSPLLRKASLSTKAVKESGDESRLLLQLYSVELFSGKTTMIDQALMAVAPIILTTDLAPPLRLYIIELAENEPSRRDVEAALAGTGVAMVKVPNAVAGDDAWLQDQFQMAYCQTPDGVMDVVIHLPRLQSNAIEAEGGLNLAPFVTSHFRSHNIGVFDDFWKREFPIRDVTGKEHRVDFTASNFLQLSLLRASLLRRKILTELGDLGDKDKINTPEEYTAMLKQLPQLAEKLSKLLDKEAGKGTAERQKIMRAKKIDLKKRMDSVGQSVVAGSRGIKVHAKLPSGSFDVELPTDELDRLFARLRQAHDGTNFGGNIEASPPLQDDPHGVIVIGNVHDEQSGETVDPDLLHFLRSQKLQRLVEIDTRWLSVGHVDEVMSFVPAPEGNPPFAIALASPRVALSLLRRAEQRYILGSGGSVPENFTFAGAINRATVAGKSPVTMLLRGKEWLHHHSPDAFRPLEPPHLYLRMAVENAQYSHKGFNIPYIPGEGSDRTYPAALSVRELLSFGADSNEEIHSKIIDVIESELQKAFIGVDILPVPVFYDVVQDVEKDQTGAFLPNLANSQIIGKRMLVPRPYGPRMKTADAIDIVGAVFEEFGHGSLKSGLTVKKVEQRGFNRTTHWVLPPVRPHYVSDAQSLANIFADGFPKVPEADVTKRIIAANPSQFNAKGELRAGWRQVQIPENTVDLFELYTSLLLESVGAEVHFVDSWYYHVRLGEIHCGTNVLRRAQPTGKQQAWWVKEQYREQPAES